MRLNRKIGRVTMALGLLLGLSIAQLTTLPASARASEAVVEEADPGPGGEAERWWGVLGAALCGAEVRLIIRAPAIGMNPYALAAGIAGCTLALIDVMTTE